MSSLRNQQRNSSEKLKQWGESQLFNSVMLPVALGGHFNSRAKTTESIAVSHTASLII